jgi:LacI family transcriptional regulator
MKKIGLKLMFQDHYDNSVAKGVLKYSKNKIDWEINGTGYWFHEDTKEIDALIARIETLEEKEMYEKLDIPVVDIAGAFFSDRISTVRNDDWDTGVRCGNYFYNLGVRNFAMCLVSNTNWSRERMLGFCSSLNINYEKLNCFSRPLTWWKDIYNQNDIDFQNWLKSLPLHTGLFCCNDLSAMKVTNTLRYLSINVPSDIIILGVDNEELMCMLSKPTISSMALQLEKIGYTAAMVLDSIIEDKNKKLVYRIPPLDVVERESTTLLFDGDVFVTQAILFIKKYIGSSFSVNDIVNQIGCSRRTLEIRFRKILNTSIHSFIVEEKLLKARELLVRTNLQVKEISSECGFGSLQRFHASFIKKYGISPNQYRILNSIKE